MLNRNGPKPLYQQLKEIIEGEIETGKWEPNEKIPSENELGAQYNLSRMTVRGVISELVNEGKLYRVQGKGTFVADKIETVSPSYVGIREQLEKMGYQVKTKIVACEETPCGKTAAKNLKLRVGQTVYMVKRVRSIKDGPISYHISYIKKEYGKDLSPELLEQEQLCVVLNEKFGLVRSRVEETLETVLASGEEAEMLGIEEGHPLLLLRDVIYDTHDKPYEYTKVLFRGDKIKIRLEYK